MKKRSLITLILICYVGLAFSQSCLPEGITFTSQEQLNNFKIDYPGCTEIEGGVYISGENISNLNSLMLVTSIGGNLNIIGNELLTNLTGLNNLTSIGGTLYISGNELLTDLTRLNNLTSIGGNLYISSNKLLTNLMGLNNLASIGGTLYISENELLTNLTGLNNLTSIGGILNIDGNEMLTNLMGLNNLTSIGGNLYITNNPSINNIAALENIWPGSIGGLYITGNSNLSICNVAAVCRSFGFLENIVINSNATGCNSIEEVRDSCLAACPQDGISFETQAQIDSFQINYPGCTIIEGNVQISGRDINNLNGLNEVMAIGEHLSISGNYILTDLSGLGNLATVAGTLSIGDNPSLTSLTGLDNLVFVDGEINIDSNIALLNLSGLNSLSSFGPNLSIAGNNALTSLEGLENLTNINSLYIIDNDALSDLTGLNKVYRINFLKILNNNSLTSLTGLNKVYRINFLKILNNNSLTSLTGLENLTSLGSYVNIEDNDALTSLTGLGNVTSIEKDLIIESNHDLASLTGFENLTSIGESLKINNNPTLSSIVALANTTYIGGPILEISGNSSLASLTGLEKLDTLDIQNLTIADNSSLSYCEVQIICNYLAGPWGEVNIYNNAPGCNNPGEVAGSCEISLPCLPLGNYYFTSQAEIDSFQSFYPGCTELTGAVFIDGDDISNLNGLLGVTSIEERLSIGYAKTGNPLLTSLAGLDSLVFIGGGLAIDSNVALTSLSGLEALTYTGSLFISNNVTLTSLSGLEGLTSVGGLHIVDNDALINLTGLDNLTCIINFICNGWGVKILVIQNNDALINLEGLENLTTLLDNGGWGIGIDISYNDELVSLKGIENIEADIYRLSLSILNNPSLSFCNVQSICDYLAAPGGIPQINDNAPGCINHREVKEACTESVDELSIINNLSLYPNPGSGAVHLRYSIRETRNLKLELYSIEGILIRTLLHEMQQPGEGEMEFDVSGLPGGLYFIRMQSGDSYAVGKLVVIH